MRTPGERINYEDAFPHQGYREHQEDILSTASEVLYNERGVDNVVIDAPTGIGKSAINTALARQSESAFMTTPQKKLRRQLEDDSDLNLHYETLRARADFICRVPGTATDTASDTYTCETCPINQKENESCMRQPQCPYWTRKEVAMDAKTAVITFAYLIVDGMLPPFNDENERISFQNRELLIVDECHSLEDQVASLFAGFTVSPYGLPESVYGDPRGEVDIEDDRFEQVRDYVEDVHEAAGAFYDNETERIANEGNPSERRLRQLKRVKSLKNKIEWCLKEVDIDDRPWVVDVELVKYEDDDDWPSVTIKPVYVDTFLEERVWSRSDKRILSSASIPFRGFPEKWLNRIGLDPDRTKVISKPMPFPAENREVHTRTIIESFSHARDKENWSEIVDTLDLISRKHQGQKGLIHTVSYDRAEELHQSFSSNAVLHEESPPEGYGDEYFIREWQEGEKDMLLSPALMEGVDLPDEKCRWQVLVKVPYPHLADPRTSYLIDEESDWDWYYDNTARSILQSVGRGVRSETDYCSYYVLDGSFLDVLKRAELPEWFREAVKR